MAIAIILLIIGIITNLVMLAQPRKTLPRFAETCEGCGCQAPPMAYPPAVYECPVCQWMEQHCTRKIGGGYVPMKDLGVSEDRP